MAAWNNKLSIVCVCVCMCVCAFMYKCSNDSNFKMMRGFPSSLNFPPLGVRVCSAVGSVWRQVKRPNGISAVSNFMNEAKRRFSGRGAERGVAVR